MCVHAHKHEHAHDVATEGITHTHTSVGAHSGQQRAPDLLDSQMLGNCLPCGLTASQQRLLQDLLIDDDVD